MKRFFMATLLFVIFGASGTESKSKIGTIDNPRQIPDSIVISSNRYPTPIEKSASSVTIITEEQINNSQTVMVSELLKQVPGIDIVRSGGAGAQTSLFIRGTNSNHTLVIIDGIEMNNPSSVTTSFDFATLNVSNIQRIEVLRGPQSVLYGSDAVGGVIQIFTKRGYGNLRADIVTEAGSYNSFTESIHLSGSEDKIDYSLYLSRKDSDGFSTIREDAGGIEKDGFESSDLVANIGIQIINNYELILNGRISDSKVEIDNGFGIFEDPNNSSDNKINSFGVRLKSYNLNAKYYNPQINVTVSDQELVTNNDFDDLHPFSASASISNGKRFKVSASNNLRVIENMNTILGVEYEEEKYNSSSMFSFYDFFGDSLASSIDLVSEIDAVTFSLYGLDDWAINEQFSVSGGLRYDNHEDFGSQVTYRFTSLYHFLDEGITLKATYGSAFKAPSLYQLNHPVNGNPNLKPEENVGWEVGFEKATPDKILKFGATYFSNEIDNMFIAVYDFTDESFRSYNIAEASSNGVELFAQISVQNSSLRIDATYTNVKDKTNESNILRRPKEKISFKFNHKFSELLQANLHMHTVGNRYDRDFSTFPNQDVVLGGYTVINVSTSYQVMQNVIVTGRVDNLFNEDYQDVLRYNTASRSGYVGLKLSL